MTYVVIYGYSTYGSHGQYGSANAQDFNDDGTLIGSALGTWYITEYGTPVNGLLTRASTAIYNYNPIKLSDSFYNANKTEIDTWIINNPAYAPRFSFSGYPPPCTPNWSVGAWGICQQNNTQIRTVKDLNNCNIITGKPPTIQTCTYKPPSNNTLKYASIAATGLVILYLLMKKK